MQPSYKNQKQFGALDDLYVLLEQMESTIGVEISDKDYIIGRKQLFYVFLHETMHAFITKTSRWIHDLPEDETDFVDELVVRVVLDDLIKDLDLLPKIDTFYENNIDHKTDLKHYGFPLEEVEYDKLCGIWKKSFYQGFKINDFCRYVHQFYLDHEHLKRSASFQY
jgi:hypothetical protein